MKQELIEKIYNSIFFEIIYRNLKKKWEKKYQTNFKDWQCGIKIEFRRMDKKFVRTLSKNSPTFFWKPSLMNWKSFAHTYENVFLVELPLGQNNLNIGRVVLHFKSVLFNVLFHSSRRSSSMVSWLKKKACNSVRILLPDSRWSEANPEFYIEETIEENCGLVVKAVDSHSKGLEIESRSRHRRDPFSSNIYLDQSLDKNLLETLNWHCSMYQLQDFCI